MVKTVSINSIVTNDKTQHRANISFGHVGRIRDAILSKEVIKPISVVSATDASNKVIYILVDGWHRYEAAVRAECDHIDVDILNPDTEGNLQLAIELSLKANAENGNALPREYGDIMKAANAAADVIYQRKLNLIKGIDFNPYPKIYVDEIKEAVQCSTTMAERVSRPFNKAIKEKQKRNILIDCKKGCSVSDVAINHACSQDLVRQLKRSIEQISNKGTSIVSPRGQGIFIFGDNDDIEYVLNNSTESGELIENKQEELLNSQQATKIIDSEDENAYPKLELDEYIREELASYGIEELRPRPKHDHRITELDIVVEEDLRMYLLNNYFFDAPKKEVGCRAGRVDIVADNEIVEIKRNLTRSSMFTALGQITTYAQDFPGYKRTIAGLMHKDVERMGEFILSQGVDIVTIDQKTGEIRRRRGVANGI